MVDCKKKDVILFLNCNVYLNDVIKTDDVCDVYAYKNGRYLILLETFCSKTIEFLPIFTMWSVTDRKSFDNLFNSLLFINLFNKTVSLNLEG